MIMCVCRGEVMCPDFMGWRQKLAMADDVPRGRGGSWWWGGECGPILCILVRALLKKVSRVALNPLKSVEMEGYGQAALSTPHPPQVEKVTLVYQVGEQRASPQRIFRSSFLSLILKPCLNGRKSFRSFYYSPDSNMLMSRPSARSSRSRARKRFFSGR